MKSRRRLLPMMLGTYATIVLSVNAEPADHVFLGDHIITMRAEGNSVSALAISHETIVWLGDRADAVDWIGPDTVVHELGERALLPGFIDAHGHLLYQGIQALAANVASPPVGPVTDIASLKATVAEYIEAKGVAPGEPVMGFGYDDSLLREKRHPTRYDLDEVSREHPIVLIHVSGHLLTANSMALESVGYGPETEDPEGGHIRRRSGSREPNGVVEETAGEPLQNLALMANFDPATNARLALDVYASHGVTTVQDGRTPAFVVPVLAQLAQAGVLNLDVVAYVGVDDPTYKLPPGFEYGSYNNRLKIGGVKLMLDGSPQGKTAFLSVPYHVPPHGQGTDYRGYPIQPQADVDAMVKSYLDQQVPILAHANGDAAAEMLIGAVERAAPVHDHRTVMIHAQTVRIDQLDQMATLGMIPSFFSSHVFYWGDWHRDSVLGPERGKNISPLRSSEERGIKYTLHNDAPVVPPDMIRLLWASVNRLTRSGQVLGPDQRLTTYEALEGITTHAAHQYFEEDRKGTLDIGKLADLVVLSTNPLDMDPLDMQDLHVDATWSRGELVYERTSEAI